MSFWLSSSVVVVVGLQWTCGLGRDTAVSPIVLRGLGLAPTSLESLRVDEPVVFYDLNLPKLKKKWVPTPASYFFDNRQFVGTIRRV